MTGYVNIPPTSGQVRQPRVLLALGDQLLDFERLTVTHSGTHQAGTLSGTIRSVPGSDIGQWGWWFSQGVIVLDVFAGFPANPRHFTTTDLTRLCTIRIDQVSLEVGSNTLSIEGRDLSAILIDKKTDGQFQNQTSSQVAQQFAQDAGLDYKIQPTMTKIGTYYDQDYVHMQREQTQWALLVYLARKEGFDCFVLGRTLYFGKYANTQQRSYLIQLNLENAERHYHESNAVRLVLTHDLTLSRDVIVTVRSFNTKTGKAYSALAKATGGKVLAARNLTPILPKTAADPQNYVFVIPNLAPIEAQKKALQLAQEIVQHELHLSADLPGDDVLYPWVPIELQGTGTLFDTTFYPSEVSRTLTPNDFTMSVRAKNHPTGTEVALD